MSFPNSSQLALLLLAAAHSVPLGAQALAQVAVAGQGYQLPSDTIIAAPGQVLMISVFGVQTRLAAPVKPNPGPDGLPTTVNGITADFVQRNLTVALPIRMLQQSACPSFGGCSPSTTLTVQIPYELKDDSLHPAAIRVKEGGYAVTEVKVKAVSDQVHIVNACDQTGIYLSLASDVPPGVCAPMIMHARGPLVSDRYPAVAGETLVVWAYGLGALSHPSGSPCCSTPDEVARAAQPFTVNATYRDAATGVYKRLETTEPAYVGMSGSGLYQVHVTAAGPPANAERCGEGNGKVRITINGPSSADGAEICVGPNRWFNTTELQNNFNSR
ncbi:MAG TPA: hypothetical protein VFQ91_04130 [Bryobacteraceae bacterium]|nr:hypothetical protein [Bryobacteraceae bacterium]